MGKLVAGVGVNDAGYPVVRFGKDINGKKNREWVCPFYKTWSGMLNRCYRNPVQAAYKDTTVCDDWHTFSNFKSWMETQDWEDKDLDKDLLTDNNQYSPTNCLFIPSWLNTLISGERNDSCHNLIAIYESQGRYTSSPSCGSVVHSESYIDVRDAIDHYHRVKVSYTLSLGLPANLEELTLKFFGRRKQTHIDIVESNPEMFPTRGFEIKVTNLPKVGDMFRTFRGNLYTILDVENCEKILIKFEDGSTRFVRNSRIADGSIKKPSVENPFIKIKERIDKIFKWNSHDLISGIQTYHSRYYGVSYKLDGVGKCFYTTDITEALKFREEMLVERVTNIVGNNRNYLENALRYFHQRWETEVVKYLGKSTTTL